MQELEIKNTIEQLNVAFEEFKKSNDLAKLEEKTKGYIDPLLEEKTAKLNSRIDELQVKLDRVQASPVGSESKKQDDAYAIEFKKFVAGKNFDVDALEQKAMSVNSNADGGYVVTAEMGRIISDNAAKLSAMRQLATVTTIGSDALDVIVDKDTSATAGWVGEKDTRGESGTPKFGVIRIESHELYARPRATQKLLDDAQVNIEAWLAQKISQGFAEAESQAFISGDGVKQPVGLLHNVNLTGTGGNLKAIKSGANGTLGTAPIDKLIDLKTELKAAYANAAVFLMNREVLGAIRKLKDDQGQYLWQPAVLAGTPSTLIGHNVFIDEYMTGLTTGSKAVVFGDIRSTYNIVDRFGIRLTRDPYSAKPYVEFYTTKRVGGGVVNYEAAKVLQLSA